jgi:uncharacterized protein YkwD
MTLPCLAAFAALLTVLGACSPGGGGALSTGLTARMDQPGAQLDRAEALGIINHYRAVSGAPPLRADAGLDSEAQQLAAAYAQSGTAPRRPGEIAVMRVSAGYANFADTFSGWRNSPADAAALAQVGTSRAGIAVAYNDNSTYGVHWVLLIDD